MTTLYLIYVFAAVAGIMIAEAVYLLWAGRSDRREAINRRVRLQAGKLTQEQVLIQLRKERGITGDPHLLSRQGLRRLRIRSGLIMPVRRFVTITTGIAAVAALFGFYKGMPIAWAMGGFAVLVPLLPIQVLRFMLKRRHKRFGVQLPEALELITRGLKAGHPVPVAIAMVAREMPDPIGSEFGMVADEVTYGSDLVTALANLFERVGQEDLPLFVTAVSIQSSTGGNLREILDGLASTIRERGKLRRKVRAISTEGRMSAYILTAVPCLLMAAILTFMPQFYEVVWGEAMTWWLLGGSVAWLMLGNMMMFKMANFRF